MKNLIPLTIRGLDWFKGLNLEQVQAVQHNKGPLLILAGAGSGKTTVLVSRAGRLISDEVVRPEQICVLTFTNKAAKELKHRLTNRLGEHLAKGLWAGTFHSLGLKILRQFHREACLPSQFGIIDQNDSQTLLRELLKDIKVAGRDKFDLEKVLQLVNDRRFSEREKLRPRDEYDDLAEILLPKYIKKMDLLGVVDFEGLLLKPLSLFKSHPFVLEQLQSQFHQVMVDEFQDTNKIQMQLIHELVKKHQNICVVGDDDQSIYGWRGAEISNILNFPNNYKPCQVIRLEKNYRSLPPILNLANDVIKNNKKRHGKVLQASLRPEEASQLPEVFFIENEEEEAEFIKREVDGFIQQGFQYKDIAILYRANTQSSMIESLFRESKIPYSISGGTSYFERKEIKDLLAYLRQSLRSNDVAFRRIINTPARGIGDISIEKLIHYSQLHDISFVKAAYSWKKAGVPEKAGEALEQLFDFLKALPFKILNPLGSQTAGEAMVEAFKKMGFRDYILSLSAEATTAEKRWFQVETLGKILDAFVKKGGFHENAVLDFLDALELRDVEEDSEKNENQVSLMTLHASKGLEFPIILLVGVEEDLLPHRTLGSDVDEERRLFYVGLTRAKKRLVLSSCKYRKKFGGMRPVAPSRFLLEMNDKNIQKYQGAFRPIKGAERDSLVANFLAKLDKKKP